MCNTNYRVLIETVVSTDNKSLTDIQKKINQWITTGLLVKYEIHTAGNNVVFNICLKKSS